MQIDWLKKSSDRAPGETTDMDQNPHQDFVGNPMRACDGGEVEPLLRTSRDGEFGEPEFHEAPGSDVYGEAIFRISQDDLVALGTRAPGESEAGGKTHEKNGTPGNGSWATHEPSEPEASGVSICSGD
jgi:hypothetical protein